MTSNSHFFHVSLLHVLHGTYLPGLLRCFSLMLAFCGCSWLGHEQLPGKADVGRGSEKGSRREAERGRAGASRQAQVRSAVSIGHVQSLSSKTNRCVLAAWHRPRGSSCPRSRDAEVMAELAKQDVAAPELQSPPLHGLTRPLCKVRCSESGPGPTVFWRLN